MLRRKPKAIILDLDGTLCECTHRQHFMQERPKRRDEFHSACIFDTVNPSVAAIIDMAKASQINVILLSARPAYGPQLPRFRKATGSASALLFFHW